MANGELQPPEQAPPSHWLLERLFPKRTRFERQKRRAVGYFVALAFMIGGVDVWIAALSRIDLLQVKAESLRVHVDTSPAGEPYFGIGVLLISAAFLSLKVFLNLLADRVQRQSTPR